MANTSIAGGLYLVPVSRKNLKKKLRVFRRNFSVFLLIFYLLLSQLLPLASFVQAATSPWTQTDWSTGDLTSSSNLTTSTAGQATLTKNEELTNTGFESDLTSWSTTATLQDSDLAGATGAVAAWPFDETSTTQSYARVINPTLATGRDVVINGGFDADTNWTKGTGVTISGGLLHYSGITNGVNTSQTAPVSIGKVYEITYTVSNYSAGSVQVRFSSSLGTIRTANGTYTEKILATSASLLVIAIGASSTFDVDNIIVKQVDFPAYNGTPSQILTDGDMETADTSSWTAFNSAALSKQTTSPHGGSRLLRITENGVAAPAAGQTVFTVGTPYRVFGYARSDGSATPRIRDSAGTTLWTGTTSTAWQPFDFVVVAAATGLRLDTASSTLGQYVEFDDVIVSLNTGLRQGELTQDGDMETSGTGFWVSAQSGSLSKQTSSPHGGTQVLRVSYNGVANPGGLQAILANGKRYRLTGYFRGDGTYAPRVVTGGTVAVTGTSSTTWQSFDVTIIPTGGTSFELRSLATAAGYAEFDDVNVVEVAPLVGLPIGGVTRGVAAGGHLTNAYSFNGNSDGINNYSTDLNGAFNPSEGTLVVWAKVSGSGVWTDGTTHYLARLTADGTNEINLTKIGGANNTVRFGYEAGAGNQLIDATVSTTDWFQTVATWSKTNDQVKFYVNGAQVGTTQTGLGTWVGNIASTTTAIGANGSAGGLSWSGLINDVRLYNQALSDSQILSLYTGTTTTRDTTTTYSSSVGSAKIVTSSDQVANFLQTVNVGDANSYNLSAYAYTNGSAVTSSDVQLYYNGSAISTTYTAVGSGWYQLTATITGANESRTFGAQVKAGKTVYLDNISVNNYPASGTLTSSIFDSGQGSNWGTLTFAATTPTNTTATVKVRTSNSSTMVGATDFASCTAITSGSDISSNSCVTDTDRYAQYFVTLASSDLLNTPTFENISISFETSDDVGPTIELDSPGDKSYTNQERPSFKWKTTADAADYDLSIDNPTVSGQPSGDFSITDIPVSRTEDYVTNKYTVHYDGFSDSDANNNYISVYTKSSSDWSQDASAGENDGKLREGVVNWRLTAKDSVNNSTSANRTLFVDRTNPNSSFSQINSVPMTTNNFSTTDQTPTLFGKIVDPLAGGDATQAQTEDGPRVASGPKLIAIKVEQKQGLFYQPHTSYTINFDKPWYTCDNQVVEDNTKQKCDKYLPFEYQQKNELSPGVYKITLTGKDKVDNQSPETVFFLTVKAIGQIATPEAVVEPEKPVETAKTEEVSSPEASVEAEITIPEVQVEVGQIPETEQQITQIAGVVWQNAGSFISGLFGIVKTSFNFIAQGLSSAVNQIAALIGRFGSSIAQFIGHTYNSIAQAAPQVIKGILLAFGNFANSIRIACSNFIEGVKIALGNTIAKIAFTAGTQAENISHSIGTAIVKVGYLFLSEPTTISNVKVAEATPTSMTITWTTNHPATTKVNYGLTEDYGNDVQSEEMVTEHKVVVTGLTANTTYYYEVMSQNRDYVYDANHTFVTPAE